MANLKSAKKRVLVNNKKRMQNNSYRSRMRTQIKKVESLIDANDVEGATNEFNKVVKLIDRTVQNGTIHKNNGNRQKSRLAKKIRHLKT